MVVAFVAKETEPGETRVAAVPETVKALAKSGIEVCVEQGAGLAAGFLDQEYADAGAQVVGFDALGNADLVLRVLPPREGTAEVDALRAGAILVSSLQPMLRLPLVAALAEKQVTTIALDLVPRITRAQKMDILSSQATAAGYQAVLLAAVALPKFFPLLMTAAGTIAPAKVFVLGAGVAGLQAIATARRLGAQVEANDIRPAVKEQVESLGAKFVDTGTPPEAEGAGGYARETSAEYQRKQREILAAHVAAADVVITTAAIPGRKAPVLVTRDMVAAMRRGSVIVDLAAAMGGNVEGSRPGETVTTENGVKILGESNLAAQVASDASRMFARNVAALLGEFVKDGKIALDFNNEVLA
ncbi:MAG TPA: Re/Si-specific NAD(P)(+) transhydrogenase subunit alpha, partial [Planctomycetota bacterium]|nr:Re/Si-specific NAD(P)(+) transhydrogenase subunit alpha [Planctomycetota bacterium]